MLKVNSATKQSVIFDYAIRRMKHKVRESYNSDCFTEFILSEACGIAMTTRKDKEGYTGGELNYNWELTPVAHGQSLSYTLTGGA